MCDEGAAQGAGGAGRSVLGKGAEARLTEDMATRMAAVGAVVHIKTHCTGVALSALLLAVSQTWHTLTHNTESEIRY